MCAATSPTVSEANTQIVSLRTKGMLEVTTIFSVEAVGQIYNQTNGLIQLGGNVNHNTDPSIEIDPCIRNA